MNSNLTDLRGIEKWFSDSDLKDSSENKLKDSPEKNENENEIKSEWLSNPSETNKRKKLDFSEMFSFCPIRSVEAIAEWKVSEDSNFQGMFERCPIEDFSSLQKWFPEKTTNEIKSILK